MRTVTFYSYKGGTGRSLALSHLARVLASAGQKVFALDFDLEAPGLHYKLRPDGGLNRGVVDLLHDFVTGASAPASLQDFTCRVDSGPGAAEILLMPAGALPRAAYWKRLAQLDWHDLFYRDGAPGVPLFLELQERIRREFAPDVLLIDARTGVSELGGVATGMLADDLVCLTVHNDESLEGTRAVLRSVLADRARVLAGRGPIRILPVLARIPANLPGEEERRIVIAVRDFLNQEADDLVETLSIERVYVLHSEPMLQVNELSLIDAEPRSVTSKLLEDYLRLFAQLLPVEVADRRLRFLTEHSTSYAPSAHRVFVRDDPPAASSGRSRKWETVTLEIHRLLEADSAAAETLSSRDATWRRSFDAGGAEALATDLLEKSTLDEVLVNLNEAHRILHRQGKSAETVEAILARIVPLLYDRQLVYSLPSEPGGVVLQVPVATATLADIALASIQGRPLSYLKMREPETDPEPAARIGLPEGGIDFSGERAFRDFVDHLADLFVAEEDRRTVRESKAHDERYEELTRLIDDELDWRAGHGGEGLRRYFLFDGSFARDHAPLLARIHESLPSLTLIQLTADDGSQELQLSRPLRELLYRTQVTEARES